MTPAEHNAAEWLRVCWLDRVRGHGHLAGWYVIRTCPCHHGEPVTLGYEERAGAERVRRLLLGEDAGPGGTRICRVEGVPPPRVAPGQVWRRNRLRGERYFRVADVVNAQARVYSVKRVAQGQWARVPGAPFARIAVKRMEARAVWNYTWIEGP